MMSFQAWAVFQSLSVLLCCNMSKIRADYASNPFFQGVNTDKNSPKDINQLNVAVVIPPGKEPFLTRPGDKPPSPPAPGYVWVQVPISNTPVNEFKPSTAKPLPPASQIPITQQPPVANSSAAPPQTSTREPLITIEPPGVLHGNNQNAKCLQPRGQFPSNSCNQYVNCWEGVAIEESCPNGLVFNPTKLYCDYPANVDCQGKPVINTTPAPLAGTSYIPPSNPVQTVTSSPVSSGTNPSLRKFCLKSTGLFPGSTCGKFVNCWDDNAVEQDCPEGLHFSSEGYCDYPERARCGYQDGHDIPEKLNNENSECPLEFGTFRERTNCSQYYICAYSKVAAKYACPEGFSFSDILGICDYSYRVDCSKEPQIFRKVAINPKGNDLPFNSFAHSDLLQPANIGDSRCVAFYGTVRDINNCSSYYVCEMGQVVASYVCPQGYKFSNELSACDLEDRVNCEDPSRVFNPNIGTMPIPDISAEILTQVQKCVPGSVFRLNPQCTSACHCRNGVAEIIQCPAGLAYDSQMDKCVSAHLARC